jgi:DNA polymerase-3 subunit gamma/tau
MEAQPATPKAYRVLALKYRPQNFDELIGQDALVRTLKNAIQTGRLANAYMLTGVRGVGKTTTARIIAKALNYKGPDGTSGPTTGPTDDCALCKAISEDRHPDVMEMDAASRTGVDDIREILDGVRYAPSEARYKIYIIDEVHMLSKNAFNALLKTLEEPPPHVKFIFATTEIRKVPVTVLSRCQRFDLRRVDIGALHKHFLSICEKEGVTAEDDAITLIARAADGSVRDGLSLLDQAIALGGTTVSTAQVQDMLGLSDRGRGLDLLEAALKGDTAASLSVLDEMVERGGDPLTILQDVLELTHLLSRQRAVPNGTMAAGVSPDFTARLSTLASQLSMASLAKSWQILLKGVSEVQSAPNPLAAAEMILIRLAYAAELPDPAELLRKLKDGTLEPAAQKKTELSAPSSLSAPPAYTAPLREVSAQTYNAAPAMGRGGEALALLTDTEPAPLLITLEETITLLEDAGEVLLAGRIYQFVHLVKLEDAFDGSHLEFRPAEGAPPNLAQSVREGLIAATKRRWMVSISSAPGSPTLAETTQARLASELAAVKAHPLMQSLFTLFPGAEILDIKKT